jgi:tetratricopeptide (TPR) repeat protein
MSEERAAEGEWPRELSLDAKGGPAPYITRAKADALIANALAHAGYAELRAEPKAVEPKAAAEPRRRLAISSAAAVALLACLGVGSASAAVMWYVREQAPQPLQPVVTQRLEQQQKAARKHAHVAPPVAAPVAEPAPRIELPEQVLESTHPKLERRAPEDWLVEGNHLRGERRWAKADEAYAQALRSAPHSQTAYVARVASAAVRLEHLNDPAGALALYRAALREAPDGALREEVLFGIADAQRALGNTAAERATLERFLREHPSSALAAQARSRLQ